MRDYLIRLVCCVHGWQQKRENRHILFLELGVGGNTPGIIKYPVSLFDFARISGIGVAKVSKYGKEFVGLLRKELGLKREKGDTYAETLMLLMQNYSIEEIASARDLKPVTVYSHIAWLIKEKKFTEWHRFLTVYEIEAVAGALKNVNYTGELKPIYEALNEEIDYGKIRLAIAVLELENE